MATLLEKFLSEIRISEDPIQYLIDIHKLSDNPKTFYLSDMTAKRFGELPLDIVPKDLADRFKKAYINLAIELLSSNHEKFEDCPSWNSYLVVQKDLGQEIRKHPSPYDY